jgi:hypothetical protein
MSDLQCGAIVVGFSTSQHAHVVMTALGDVASSSQVSRTGTTTTPEFSMLPQSARPIAIGREYPPTWYPRSANRSVRLRSGEVAPGDSRGAGRGADDRDGEQDCERAQWNVVVGEEVCGCVVVEGRDVPECGGF